MAETAAVFNKVFKEHLALGSSTGVATLADDTQITLTEIDLSAFLSGLDTNSIVIASGESSIVTDTLLTYDTGTDQMTLGTGATLSVGETGATADHEIHVQADGQCAIKIENSGATSGDAQLIFAKNGTDEWNISLDDSSLDDLMISAGTNPSATPHMTFHGGVGTAVTIGEPTLNNSNLGGLTIFQGSRDDEILTLKSSDVAHGMTLITETDTYGRFKKFSSATGGIDIQGLGEDDVGIRLAGIATNSDTSDTSGSFAATMIESFLKSGTGSTSFGNTANILAVTNSGATRMLIKGNGDMHLTNTTLTALDDHDDIGLLEAYRATTVSPEDMERFPVFQNSLGAWFNDKLEVLQKSGVIGPRDEDGNFLYSVHGLNGLIIDALRQLAGRVADLESGRDH
jgi:hypothetical protein